MDAKPTADETQLQSIQSLQQLNQSVELPFSPASQLLSSTIIEQMHVVGMDEEQAIRHVVLDRDGHAVHSSTILPIQTVEGMATCDEEAVVTGRSNQNQGSIALFVTPQGTVQREVQLPPISDLVLEPLPFCVNQQTYLLWTTGTEASTLWIARLDTQSAIEARPLQSLSEPILELQGIVAEGGITLVLTHGASLQMELLRIVDGTLVQQQPILDSTQVVSPTLTAIGDRYAVLWISKLDETLRLRWMDWKLQPIQDAQILARGQNHARLYSSRILQSASGYLAISYLIERTGSDWFVYQSVPNRPRRHLPKRTYQHLVAAYDWQKYTLGEILPVAEPSVPYNVGSWTGDRLLMITGQHPPLIISYQPALQ